jgi:gentisate 1,2-dioxygenase
MTPNIEAARSAYYRGLAPHALAPLWTVLKSLVTPEPRTPMMAHVWHYEAVRPLLMRAGELISAEEAERRVLILENPALPGAACITRTLYAGLQLILPGEIASCHRHTQSALRFVLEGEGAYTAVDGERAIMRPFDLVLTPNGRWHDHGNDSDAPMIWLDGLDIPLVTALDASFSEHLDGRAQHPRGRPDGDSLHRHGANLRPASGAEAAASAPLFHYPYSQWRKSLAAMAAAGPPDAHDGYRMEFINPADGGPAMRTISAFCQLLPAGFQTEPQHSTDGQVYVVVEGNGTAWIGEQELAFGPRDTFVVPAWMPRSLSAATDLVLFSYSDKAVQEKLGLWRWKGAPALP